jgi:hypothetical protein
MRYQTLPIVLVVGRNTSFICLLFCTSLSITILIYPFLPRDGPTQGSIPFTRFKLFHISILRGRNGILNSSFRTVFQNRFEIVSNCSLASPHKLRVLAHINWSLVDNGFFTVKRIVASSRLSVLWARWTLSFSLNRLVAILPIVGSSERHSTFGGNRPRDTDGVLRKEVQNFGPPF